MPNQQPPESNDVPVAKKKAGDSMGEIIGMQKWLQRTARKQSRSKQGQGDNDAAKAAADAIAEMLGGTRRLG